MTGFEYIAAVLMMNWGMVDGGFGVRAEYSSSLRRGKAKSMG